MNIWSGKLLFDEDIVHVGILMIAKDACKLRKGLGRVGNRRNGFTLVAEGSDGLRLDVSYQRPL